MVGNDIGSGNQDEDVYMRSFLQTLGFSGREVVECASSAVAVKAWSSTKLDWLPVWEGVLLSYESRYDDVCRCAGQEEESKNDDER
jgi:hypothetical protein